ncbi:MAG: patatin-like phospholipase family protein [Flavobacteriales bacterium]|nr:patatin-like phospholipase family protein [Flavobacteriales bacterium]
MNTSHHKTIGLALSGGGIRGIAQLGALKALYERNIKPSIISGTSAGSIVGAFTAAGYEPDEIFEIVVREKIFSYRNILFGKAGLFDMKSFERLYAKYIPNDDFESLEIPLYVMATDIVKAQSVTFHHGPLYSALLASCCVPLVFLPVKREGMILLDGGITNNFPADVIRDKCSYLIGIHVNSLSSDIEQIHMKDTLDRSFHIVIGQAVTERAQLCDLFIEPPNMSRFGMFDFRKMKEIFEAGYEHTKTLLLENDPLKV